MWPCWWVWTHRKGFRFSPCHPGTPRPQVMCQGDPQRMLHWEGELRRLEGGKSWTQGLAVERCFLLATSPALPQKPTTASLYQHCSKAQLETSEREPLNSLRAVQLPGTAHLLSPVGTHRGLEKENHSTLPVLPWGKGNPHLQHLGKPEMMGQTFAASTPLGVLSRSHIQGLEALERGQVQQEDNRFGIKICEPLAQTSGS